MLLQLLLSLVALAAARTVWNRWKYDVHKIPSPRGLPLVGHTLNILGNRGETELYRYIGNTWRALGQPDLFKLSLGGKTIFVLREIESARKLLASKVVPVKRPESAIRLFTPLLGNDGNAKSLGKIGQLTPYIKEMRNVYAKGLHPMTLKPAMPKVHQVMDRMMDIIEETRKEGPVNVQDLCVRMTLDVIGVLAYDANLGGLDGSRQMGQHISAVAYICRHRQQRFIQTHLYKLFPFLPSARKQQEAVDALTAEWVKLTDEILEREDPPAGEEPVWYCLKTLKDPETGEVIKYQSILAEMAVMILAGRDTTGHQLAWIFAFLGSNPHVMDKIVDELKTQGHYGARCKDLTLENLNDLVYVAAVVKEGLRAASVAAPSLGRELCKDANILGYRLPQGSVVMVPPMRWMNSRTDWGDPDVFRPERWLEQEDMSKKFYMPFSYGPRDCIGQKMAVLEMRFAIARLVERYSFTSVRPAEEVLKDSRSAIAIESAAGVWLRFEPRY